MNWTSDYGSEGWGFESLRAHKINRWLSCGNVRGTSADHPSIQLADVVAGAGRAVFMFHEGMPGNAAQAGEILPPAVVSLIAAEGLFAHDEPARFATRKPPS
jgi:hypothetical protein